MCASKRGSVSREEDKSHLIDAAVPRSIVKSHLCGSMSILVGTCEPNRKNIGTSSKTSESTRAVPGLRNKALGVGRVGITAEWFPEGVPFPMDWGMGLVWDMGPVALLLGLLLP